MFLSITSFLALIISVVVYLYFAVKLLWKLVKKLSYLVCFPLYDNWNNQLNNPEPLMGQTNDPLQEQQKVKVTNLKELLQQKTYQGARDIASALLTKKK